MRKLSILLAGTIMAGLSFGFAIADTPDNVKEIMLKYEKERSERSDYCMLERPDESFRKCFLEKQSIWLNKDDFTDEMIFTTHLGREEALPWMQVTLENGEMELLIVTENRQRTDGKVRYDIRSGSAKPVSGHVSTNINQYGQVIYVAKGSESKRIINHLIENPSDSFIFRFGGGVVDGKFETENLSDILKDLVRLKNITQ